MKNTSYTSIKNNVLHNQIGIISYGLMGLLILKNIIKKNIKASEHYIRNKKISKSINQFYSSLLKNLRDILNFLTNKK